MAPELQPTPEAKTEKLFTAVFEGDEVARFLSQFVLAGKDRDARIKAEPDAGWEHLPQSNADVLEDIKTLWRQRGFLTPAETQAALVEKYTPNAPPEIHDFLYQAALSRNAPDPITGFLSKEHAYSATGLAHLYALETQQPIAMVEVDFSNMAGTNDFFRQMLAAERGISPDDLPGREERKYTNLAMGVLCASMVDTLKKTLPEGARILPIRTGGDELRILVTGLEDSRVIRGLTDQLHSDIEKHIAGMGLQDHPHTKDPLNPARNGFGAALTIQDMGTIKNPHQLIQELDGRIKYAKDELGLVRLGQIDGDMHAATTRAQLTFGDITLPPGETPDSFIAAEQKRYADGAKRAAEKLHAMNPAYNPELPQGSRGFLKYVDAVFSAHAPSRMEAPKAPAQMDAHDAAFISLEPMATLHERRVHVAKNAFTTSGAVAHMLELSLAALTPHDPSAQALMPQVVAPTIEAYAREIKDYAKKFKPKDPAVREALLQANMLQADIGTPFAMSVSFHNLAGLNNALGHHYSDLVLRHMTEIIDQSFAAAGIPEGPPKPWLIAHDGGANFTAVIRPGVTDAQGETKFISQHHLKKAQEEIAARVEVLNHTGIAAFLADNGVHVDKKLRQHLSDEGLKTFADIKDPKIREMPAHGTTVTGKVDGIKAATIQGHISPEVTKGHIFVDELRQMCESQLEVMRREVMVRNYVTKVAEEKAQPLSDIFNDKAAAKLPTLQERQTIAVFRRLPKEATDDMAPEVNTLVQFKMKALHAADEIAAAKRARKPDIATVHLWKTRQDRAMRLFAQAFDEFAQSGGLMEVAAHFQKTTAPDAAPKAAPATKPTRHEFRPNGGHKL